MANITKYTRAHLPALFQHNNRKAGDVETLSNKDIDASRTKQNYNIVENNVAFVSERLRHFYHDRRENLVVLGEVTLTLPKDVKPTDLELFFKTAYDFYCRDFGTPNVVNAVIHMDETTPHMHLDFLPVKPIDADISDALRERISDYEKEYGPVEGRLCAREVLNRIYYQKMHPRLSDAMTKALGYECEILNGATDSGNRTVLQMKNERLAKELEVKQSQITGLADKMNHLVAQIEKAGLDKGYFSAPEILFKLDMIEQENLKLKGIISSNGIVIPPSDFKELSDVRSIFRDQHFYITESDFPDDYEGIRIVETYRKKPRIMPEWKFIEADRELEWIINNAPADMTPFNNVLIFPTDDIADTVRNLIWLKEHEREYSKLFFPQISNDKYNIAEGLLRQCRFDTVYQLKKEDIDIERGREITRS